MIDKTKEQIPCPIATCRKPIEARSMELHIRFAHGPERERLVELGKNHIKKFRSRETKTKEPLW